MDPIIMQPNGRPAPIMTNWEAPRGQAQFFGFKTQTGLQCFRVDRIAACFPQIYPQGHDMAGQFTGYFVVVLDCGSPTVSLSVPYVDMERLFPIMGWKRADMLSMA